jgi:hypothetical protein
MAESQLSTRAVLVSTFLLCLTRAGLFGYNFLRLQKDMKEKPLAGEDEALSSPKKNQL